MKKIKLSENLELSQVVMGCMRIADSNLTENELLDLVEKCLDMGVTSIDHAPVYGGYTCEKIFGDAVLRKRPELRDKMQLITKAGIVCPGHYGNKTIYYKSTKEEILKEMDESLEKLGTDHVDLLLIHRPDPLADPAETAAGKSPECWCFKLFAVPDDDASELSEHSACDEPDGAFCQKH